MAQLIQDQEEELHRSIDPFFSNLRFHNNNSNGNSHHYQQQPPPCYSCGAVKRSSPSQSSFSSQDSSDSDEPKRKKIHLDREEEMNFTLRGFSSIPLPIAYGSSSSSVAAPPPPSTAVVPSHQSYPSPSLRRCVSNPYNSPGAPNPAGATSFPDQSPDHLKQSFVNPVTPPSVRGCGSNATAVGLPPLPPTTLQRTVSEPTPSPMNISNNVDRDLILLKEESPDSKRLKRIKERMRVMSQWWSEVLSDEEKPEEDREVDGDAQDKTEPAAEDESDIEIEEGVSVEKVGEALNLRFKCTCGRVFEIIISGNNCFYKITTC